MHVSWKRPGSKAALPIQRIQRQQRGRAFSARPSKPVTFAGFSHSIFPKLNRSVGGFAAFFRRDAPARPHEVSEVTDLFPLNSGAFATGKRKRAPRSARLRGRWFARRVVDVWTNLTVEWLNFEASGRQVNHTRPQSTRRTASSEHPASASAVANVRRAVKSMYSAASGLPLAELGLGRDKIKNDWDSID